MQSITLFFGKIPFKMIMILKNDKDHESISEGNIWILLLEHFIIVDTNSSLFSEHHPCESLAIFSIAAVGEDLIKFC